MAEFGDQELGLLRALGERDAPTREDEERVARRLEVELGIALGAGALVAGAAVGTVGGAGAGAATTSTLASSVGTKWALWGAASTKWILAGVVATSTAGYAVVEGLGEARKSEGSGAPVLEEAGVARAASEPPPTVEVPGARVEGEGASGEARGAVEGAAPPPSAGSTKTASSRGDAPRRNLDAELPLIAEAQQALAQGRPEAALRTLEKHRASYPSGALVVERLGLNAVALCQAGHRDEGARRAAAFLERHGATPVAARVRKACAR